MEKDPIAAPQMFTNSNKDRMRSISHHVKNVPEVWVRLPDRVPSGSFHAHMGYAKALAKELGLQLRFYCHSSMQFSELTKICGKGNEQIEGIPVVPVETRDTLRGNNEGLNTFIMEYGVCPEVILCETGERGGFETWRGPTKQEKFDTIHVLQSQKGQMFPSYVDTGVPIPFLTDVRPEKIKTRKDGMYMTYLPSGPSVHHKTFEEVEQSRIEGEQKWGDLPKPRIAINCAEIGRDMKRHAQSIVDLIRHYPEATILVGNSPRTDQNNYHSFIEALEQTVTEYQGVKDDTAELKQVHLLSYEREFGRRKDPLDATITQRNLQVGTPHDKQADRMIERAENPYWEWLSTSDANVVLSESQSMMGEALMTGAPIYYSFMDGEDYDAYFGKPFSSRLFTLGGRPSYMRDPGEPAQTLCEERFEPFNITEYYAKRTAEKYRAFKAERDGAEVTEISEQTNDGGDESLDKFAQAETERQQLENSALFHR